MGPKPDKGGGETERTTVVPSASRSGLCPLGHRPEGCGAILSHTRHEVSAHFGSYEDSTRGRERKKTPKTPHVTKGPNVLAASRK